MDTAPIVVEEVATRKQRKAFLHFPFKLYEGNPYWVPELLSADIQALWKNPALEFCHTRYLIAHKDGEVVGRIACIINEREIEKTGRRMARFGWIDFIDDEKVSSALLDAAEKWALAHGCEAIHGPLGFTDLDREGMLIQGFEELGTIATIYNYPYYPQHLEKLGYRKSIDWVEFEMTVPDQVDERISEYSKKIAERFKIRELGARSKRDFKPWIKPVFDLLNEAYADLYGVVPLTEKQAKFYADQYFGFINPDFVAIVINEHDELVGFGITMPSLSKAMQKARGRLFPFGFIHILRAMKKNDRADFYLVAVRKDYQRKGVQALMFDKIWRTFINFGIKKVETNPELETNNAVQAMWSHYNPRNHKRRRCFIKDLS